MTQSTPVALVTGASRGLGRALAAELLRRDWRVVVDGRDPVQLVRAVAAMPARRSVVAVPGDVTDAAHRRLLAEAVAREGGLDLLVNNASVLGPSPRPRLAEHPLEDLAYVYAVNAVAPLGLVQLVLPHLEPRGGRVINVSSDAAVEAYDGWGGYGSAKAALDRITAVLAQEHPRLRIYAFDPGDMATDMHRRAFPGEDVSDRPSPESVVPALMRLIVGDLPSGRYRVAELARPVAA
jgi:NAD(P)-dependent dehydrogenase (short-subunit alcohol dehydrogenase family)